jgi:nitroreductase
MYLPWEQIMQSDFTRRDVMLGATAAAAAATLVSASAQATPDSIKLPPPRTNGGMPVMQAFAKRRSVRAYSARALDEQTMSDLLWAAFGVNRPESGDRTAPSWRHSIETDVYACTKDGVFAYDPKAHELKRVLSEDIRAKTSAMVFAGSAPVVLVFVADLARMAKAPIEEQKTFALVDSAIVGENVHLYCASAGLGTCILGTVDRAGLPKRIGLREAQYVTFAQPVGYPQ